MKNKKWYQTGPAVILILIAFYPLGLYLMWKHTEWKKSIKIAVTAFIALINVINIASYNMPKDKRVTQESIIVPSITTPTPETSQIHNIIQEKVNQLDKEIDEIPTKSTASIEQPAQTKQPVSNDTIGQKNAVKKAKSYLSISGFSHDGLVDQLEYEKFSHEDAVYGADNSGGNWNEEAAEKAKSYMDISAFSRDGLIEQLKYEKFTQEQAEYGASAVGL